ncbi:MAG: nicotinamide riboside transporter PnuC [Ferruginibacter sp.]
MNIFDINNILTTIFGYPLSYVEFIGTVLGLASVWFAAKQNILTWTTGLINIICFFAIFYQVHLYSDMFLQIYFFIVSIYGWLAWRNLQKVHKPISFLSLNKRILFVFVIAGTTILVGFFVKNIHLIFPKIFKQPASFPFIDTFIGIASIIATVFLAKRILENWILWIIVDIICVFVYMKKNILFISVEYGIFFLLASYGLLLWIKSIKNGNGLSIG